MNAIPPQPWLESFSSRELEVLQLVSSGLSNREIAQRLYLSIDTVKWYNRQMFMKLGVKSRIQAANKAAELNLLEADQAPLKPKKPLSQGNLPAQLTSYVGRKKEIAEIKDLLQNNRLVVLTGPGGSGKTRLALKVGEEIIDSYRDGVWLVELANIHDPALVAQTIANVFNLSERADLNLDELMQNFLSRKHLLLLVDNLEHLLECGPFIGELLANAPQLSIIATSRERLNIYGEQEYPVRPLNLPDQKNNLRTEELKTVESIALFIQRAHAVDPAISFDDVALEQAARICVRLDGLPLAIELCAPMVKMCPLGVIAERIENNLDAIPSGPRDLPDRQKTLRETINWSYNLLGETEKQLFVCMAIFNGGGTLQAVEDICAEGISRDISNILSALVTKNLVIPEERQDGEIHFKYLETIHQYGRDKLLASEEAQVIRDRHARYFMEMAEQGSVELRGPDQIIWTERFITMRHNFRSALEWVTENDKVETALNFVCNLFEFWLRHADFDEARWWLERAMSLEDAQQFPVRYSQAFNHLAWLYWLQGKTAQAREMAERALPMARTQPYQRNMVVALLNLGLMMVLQNDDLDEGQTLLEEGKYLSQEYQYAWELARAFMALAVAKSKKNEYNSAFSLYERAFKVFKKLGDIGFQCVVQRLIGDLEINRGNLSTGVKAYCKSLVIARSVKNNLQIAYNLWGLARVAKVEKDHARAIRLYLASKRTLEDMGIWWGGDDPELKEELTAAREDLGETEFRSIMVSAHNMTMEEVIELALGTSSFA